MHAEIKTVLDAVIALVNADITGTNDDLKLEYVVGDKPANVQDKYYSVLIDSIERIEKDFEGEYMVTANLVMNFNVYNKFESRYPAIVDNYVAKVLKYLKTPILGNGSSLYKFTGLFNVGVEGMKDFVLDEQIKPVVKMTFGMVEV